MNARISGTEVWNVVSTTNGHTYRISVTLPYGYAKDPGKLYPVVYLLDANRFFGMVTEMTRFMARCGRFPDVIIVGIGYPTSDDDAHAAFLEANRLRARDLTPAVDPKVDAALARQFGSQRDETGGADKFYAFIRDEVIPDIEQRFQTNSAKRMLAGHSYGGLFTLYALFQEPALFAGYITASPSLHYANRTIFEIEDAFAARKRDLPVQLHLSIGGQEQGPDSPPGFNMITNFEMFVARLDQRQYTGLRLHQTRLEACGHCDTPAPAFQAGLQAVLTSK